MTTPTPIPVDESALLADYLTPSLTLLDLSERHNLSLPDLLAWAELPVTADLLARLKKLADNRTALLAADHAPAAITTLSTASSTALAASLEIPDPTARLRAIESARRSAAQIVRAAPRPRAASRRSAHLDPAPGTPAPDVENPREVAAPPQVVGARESSEPSLNPDATSVPQPTQATTSILDLLEMHRPSDLETPSGDPTEHLALTVPDH